MTITITPHASGHVSAPGIPAIIGHNAPPSAIDLAKEEFASIAMFLADITVIQNETDARHANLFKSRASATLKNLDAAMRAESDPPYRRYKAVLEKYKPVTDSLSSLAKQIDSRLAAFMREEQAKRQRIADEARHAQQEAERIAREAERAEREAADNAAVGEIVDIAAAVVDANAKFAEFERASRIAKVADRDAKVRIGGGFGKVATLRTVETLTVANIDAAVLAMQETGLTEKIIDAILTAAREYRKTWGELPKGITRTTEQVL